MEPVTAVENIEKAAKTEAADKGEQAEQAEKKPRAPRRRKPAEEKPVDLAASGLQLVETKGEAIKVEKAPEAPAKPKTRKPAAWQQKGNEQATDEPLVIVQTEK